MSTRESDGRESEERSGRASEVDDGALDAGLLAAGARKQELDDEVDALLDEIDDVLEENAEEFVRGFVQKGGQ